MSHARVEEISDSSDDDNDNDSSSDPEIMDPSTIMTRRTPTTTTSSSSKPKPPLTHPSSSSSSSSTAGGGGPRTSHAAPPARAKTWAVVYPVYFDAARTRADGRRVARGRAVRSPLARALAEAVGALGLDSVFEPGKTHPRDWANPGRVRVDLGGDGRARGRVENKHHLYLLISDFLVAHPTVPSDPLKLPVRGLPMPEDGSLPPPPAVPRGWKINEILPLHSPAMSGGGISENFMKDMMAEMAGNAGQLGSREASSSGAGGGQVGKKKKEKGKGKK